MKKTYYSKSVNGYGHINSYNSVNNCSRFGANMARRLLSEKILLWCILFLSLTAGCSKVPLTGRRRLNFVPDSIINSMSLTEYQTFLSKHKLSKDSAKVALVKKVGLRISKAVEQYCHEHNVSLKGYKWEFNLVQDPAVNAWCMPGGKVVVYTGLLPVAKTEAGLATVLGHEIAHAVARHGSERMSESLLVQVGSVALDKALAEQPALTRKIFLKSYGIGTKVGILLPFSRTHEYEADHLGLIFMAMAGYDPHAALEFWQRMEKKNKGKHPPELLSTHPADSKRIAAIKKLLPEAMKYYRKYELEHKKDMSQKI